MGSTFVDILLFDADVLFGFSLQLSGSFRAYGGWMVVLVSVSRNKLISVRKDPVAIALPIFFWGIMS